MVSVCHRSRCVMARSSPRGHPPPQWPARVAHDHPLGPRGAPSPPDCRGEGRLLDGLRSGARPRPRQSRDDLAAWPMPSRHDADVVAAADAYYQNWQIWLAEAHGSHAVASSGIAPRRRPKEHRAAPPPTARVVLQVRELRWGTIHTLTAWVHTVGCRLCHVWLQVYELGTGTRLADTIRSLNSFTQAKHLIALGHSLP